MKQLKKKNLDFISALEHRTYNLPFSVSIRLLFVLIPVFMIVIGLVSAGNLLWRAETAKQEAKVIVEALETKEDVEEAQTRHIYRIMMELKHAESMIRQIPDLDSEDIAAIYKVAENAVVIENVDYEAGIFEITATVKDYKEAPAYTIRLEETELFFSVRYQGFSLEEDKEKETVYRFRIKAVSKEDAAS